MQRTRPRPSGPRLPGRATRKPRDVNSGRMFPRAERLPILRGRRICDSGGRGTAGVAATHGWRQGQMHFHFLLTNHYPYGVYKIEDHVKLISGGLAALGHKVTYGFDDDVAPWPSLNLLVEFFNRSPVVDQVIGLKAASTRYAFGLLCHEDLQDAVMD